MAEETFSVVSPFDLSELQQLTYNSAEDVEHSLSTTSSLAAGEPLKGLEKGGDP